MLIVSPVQVLSYPIKDIKKIGRYEILKPIGHGGFAFVYLGRDPYINRNVALKISSTGKETVKSPVLARLFKEASAAGSLIHPNIVTIYDVGIEGDHCYIAMEYVEGTTLYDHCLKDNLLPIADALDTMIKVCHGLDYAHQRGIIHRDIKPANILLGTSGEIKITDFGLACLKELSSQDLHTVGTPSYMPPEQAQRKGSFPQSDLYSAGVILYRLLCGKSPFEAKSPMEVLQKVVSEPHIPLKDRNPELPPKLYTIIDRALEKAPEDRYPSGFDFARDLEEVLHGSGHPLEGELATRVKSLRTLHFFEEFTEDETAQILTIGTWLSHNPSDIIISEDEKGGAFFVIAAGEVQVATGKRKLGTLVRGNCFGEMAFLLDRPRSATITATKECELLRLNPQKIDILSDKTQIKLYRLFARTIAGHLLKANEK